MCVQIPPPALLKFAQSHLQVMGLRSLLLHLLWLLLSMRIGEDQCQSVLALSRIKGIATSILTEAASAALQDGLLLQVKLGTQLILTKGVSDGGRGSRNYTPSDSVIDSAMESMFEVSVEPETWSTAANRACIRSLAKMVAGPLSAGWTASHSSTRAAGGTDWLLVCRMYRATGRDDLASFCFTRG